ncbi:MAG: XRE family transcriptional regulator [Chloroflexi bacterium]|nr:XRE family transcriptional regulator [Chloroflexota bacterium]
MTQEIVFGQWLKSRRRLYDLTQQGLADRVSCSVEMIYRIEAGQRRPSVQVARLLGAALGVPDAELDAFVGFARGAAPIRTSGTSTGLTPWRAAFIPHSTLPAQLTALIGRSKELADAAAHLRQDEVRLLTLVGPPGIGKTRLAVELGGAVLLDYPGGVHFVDLAPVSEPDRVVTAIARTLDIALADHKKPQDSLHTYLRERQMLLLLDNFEQILGAAGDPRAAGGLPAGQTRDHQPRAITYPGRTPVPGRAAGPARPGGRSEHRCAGRIRGGAAVRRTGKSRAAGFRTDAGECRGGRGGLRAAGRPAAGHRDRGRPNDDPPTR